MPTHRQQSFLATLWLGQRPLHSLDALLGKKAWVNWFGGAGVLPQLVSTVRDDSHLLSCQAGVSDQAMLLYFRHTPTGYRLYVREKGQHFGKGVKLTNDGYLGAFSSETSAPSALELRTPQGQRVSLSDLDADTHPVTLFHDGASIRRRRVEGLPYEYVGTDKGEPQTWNLHINSRNVPWLNAPYEQ
ncbi:hypothetical protein P0Y43_04790 [Pseudomonas entomophila]|uniref:hypothetical protein n=1 Tax=Pseudomonas entomophila TaxID=312306 RepID=UPI0023D8B5F4|nr:hypothetical protein [Pseudomonas entomophila]MDF0730046.1 hypothetical protein [Pseudomonas entomophila]